MYDIIYSFIDHFISAAVWILIVWQCVVIGRAIGLIDTTPEPKQ